jgi:DNA-binding HxlR family transcriptional regulator
VDDTERAPHAEDCAPFAADCAVLLGAELIAHTWDPVVLMALRAGARRRIDLLGDVAGVSDKVLTESLRRLLVNGLIKKVSSAGERSVVYELTTLGAGLANGPLVALGRWAVEHAEEVLAAQDRAR